MSAILAATARVAFALFGLAMVALGIVLAVGAAGLLALRSAWRRRRPPPVQRALRTARATRGLGARDPVVDAVVRGR